eukprot:1198364-Pyramimonas_sp.AAC.1
MGQTRRPTDYTNTYFSSEVRAGFVLVGARRRLGADPALPRSSAICAQGERDGPALAREVRADLR